jgi:hypothetical protein
MIVTKRIWLMAMMLPALVLSTRTGYTQAPSPTGVRKIYTNRTAFKLPLQVEERERGRLQEVQLYVKNGPSAPWTLKETVTPSQKEFIFRAPQDGEYWFTVATVDKSGKMNPPDIAQEGPGLIVVVDKQPPEVDVHPAAGASGAGVLQCEVRDANPDATKTKLEYQSVDQTWQALEPVPDQPGFFRVPDASVLQGVIRATATDRAGNTTTRDIRLQSAATPAPAPAVVDPSPMLTPVPSPLQKPNPAPAAVESRSDKVASPATSHAANSMRQLLNNTHVSLKYQIEQQGPSGVGKVEVWMTRDDGQTWQRLCEDTKRKSPVEIDLPGEGSYGLSLVVTNGHGQGGDAPAKGDTPDWRLEVDTTKPAAQLLSVRPGTGADMGTILISWTASDKNLKPEPIDLYYATSAEGPWQPIAKGLKNDGNYRWSGPRDAGGEFFVRMEVLDLAGNSTLCAAPQPVALDRSRPKAHVVGVVAGGSTSASEN